MIPRLYLSQDFAPEIELEEKETHYLKQVLRREEGDEIRLFNGREGEFAAIIQSFKKKSCLIKLGSQLREQEISPDIWLVCAAIKRARIDLMVEKATELGISCLQPVMTAFAQSERTNQERLEAIAIEAAEQSRRLDVPIIAPLLKLENLLGNWDKGRVLIHLDEKGQDLSLASYLQGQNLKKAAILVGPEGGFSPKEKEILQALDFCVAVSLGPRILRAETAAIAALAIYQALNGNV